MGLSEELRVSELMDQAPFSRLGSEERSKPPAIETCRGWEEVDRALDAQGLWIAWEDLLRGDRLATFYQTPRWCATWYQCYRGDFEPWLLAARVGGRLVALAPLARERETGRVLFAGDGMADYRDFICAEGWRGEVVPLFLEHMLRASRAPVLVIGHTQPESETTEIARRWAHGRARGAITRLRPCVRHRFGESDDLGALYRKKTIRQAVSYYRRNGELEFRRIRECREWERLKPTFFQQQCLRQVVAGRPLTFDNPHQQRLYSLLFESLDPEIHFSVLQSNDQPISFMFNFIYRGVLYYGAPTFDLVQARHSPGLLHLLEVMRHCRTQGYREVDFTLGTSSFKHRLANHSVELPTIYLYRSRWRYWRDRARNAVVGWIKTRLRARTGSDEAWDEAWKMIKERKRALRAGWMRLVHTPPKRLALGVLRRLRILLSDSYTAEVFRVEPEDLVPVSPSLQPGEVCEFRRNRLEDLLTLEGAERRGLTARLQDAVRRIGRGHTLHAVVVGGRLAHYGWSYQPAGSVYLPETGTAFTVPATSVSFYDFYTCEAYRGRRLYPANLSKAVSEWVKDGAGAVYIVCEARNRASRRGIERVGFRRCAVHRMRRVLGLTRRRLSDERPGGGPDGEASA